MITDKADSVLIISGSLKEEKIVKPKEFKTIEAGRTYVDGHRFDEIKLGCVLRSQEDVDTLIELLRIAKFTFDKTN